MWRKSRRLKPVPLHRSGKQRPLRIAEIQHRVPRPVCRDTYGNDVVFVFWQRRKAAWKLPRIHPSQSVQGIPRCHGHGIWSHGRTWILCHRPARRSLPCYRPKRLSRIGTLCQIQWPAHKVHVIHSTDRRTNKVRTLRSGKFHAQQHHLRAEWDWIPSCTRRRRRRPTHVGEMGHQESRLQKRIQHHLLAQDHHRKSRIGTTCTHATDAWRKKHDAEWRKTFRRSTQGDSRHDDTCTVDNGFRKYQPHLLLPTRAASGGSHQYMLGRSQPLSSRESTARMEHIGRHVRDSQPQGQFKPLWHYSETDRGDALARRIGRHISAPRRTCSGLSSRIRDRESSWNRR